MDPVTHLLHGHSAYFLLRDKNYSKKESKSLYASSLLFSILPDFDYVFKLFGDIAYFRHHRGITHSILFNIILLIFFNMFLTKKNIRIKKVLLIIASVNLALHIIFDLLTSYGTMIFEPFVNTRYSFDILFIIDLIVIAALLLPVLLNIVIRKFAVIKITVVCVAVFICGYCAYSVNHQKQASQTIKYMIEDTGVELITVLPSFVTANYLKAVMQDEEYYYYADYTKNGRFITTRFEKFDKNKFLENNLFSKLTSSEIVDFYLWFSRFPVYQIIDKQTAFELSIFDLRFYSEIFNTRPPVMGLEIVYDKSNDELSYKFRGASGKL